MGPELLRCAGRPVDLDVQSVGPVLPLFPSGVRPAEVELGVCVGDVVV